MLKSHYSSNNFLNLFQNKMNRICQILSYFFQKPIDLEIIRLHYPYNNTRILVNLIGYMINKKRVQYLIRKIIKNSRFDDYNRKIVIYNKNKIERTRYLTEKMRKSIVNKDINSYDIYKKNKIKILKKNIINTNYNNNINVINNKIKNLNEIMTIKK
jgi:hypothetical protein